jgi:hypothetical protein
MALASRGLYDCLVVTALLASILASIVTWPLTAVLEGHISTFANGVVGFVTWAIVFVPTFVWVKRLRDGG